ncbi:Uncharacterized protein TCM_023811 [Theobroma cacao]|uniref:Uncharacterized protein n=1 Tax=Theobroma cacao TaxID=3641 RepID=A0A061F2K3_THECC|nr:Uncharacterized protein TCM_023811 [Theobroma cacao]
MRKKRMAFLLSEGNFSLVALFSLQRNSFSLQRETLGFENLHQNWFSLHRECSLARAYLCTKVTLNRNDS